MSTEELCRIVRRLYEDLNQEDFGRLDGPIAPNFRLHSPRSHWGIGLTKHSRWSEAGATNPLTALGDRGTLCVPGTHPLGSELRWYRGTRNHHDYH